MVKSLVRVEIKAWKNTYDLLWIRKEKTWVIVLFYHLLAMCPWASVLNSLYLSFIIYKLWKIIPASIPHKALEGENVTTYMKLIWKYECYANLCFCFVVILKRQLVKKIIIWKWCNKKCYFMLTWIKIIQTYDFKDQGARSLPLQWKWKLNTLKSQA